MADLQDIIPTPLGPVPAPTRGYQLLLWRDGAWIPHPMVFIHIEMADKATKLFPFPSQIIVVELTWEKA